MCLHFKEPKKEGSYIFSKKEKCSMRKIAGKGSSRAAFTIYMLFLKCALIKISNSSHHHHHDHL